MHAYFTRWATVALLLVLVSAPIAHAADESGRILRIQEPDRIVIFDDGRAFLVKQETLLFVDDRPATFDTLRPGTMLRLSNGDLMILREGRYIRASEAPASSGQLATTVQAPAAQVTVDVPRSKVVVQQQAPRIVVQQQAPEVVIQGTPQPQVTLQGPSASGAAMAPAQGSSDSSSSMKMSAAPAASQELTTTVQAPAAEVTVQVPRSKVIVVPQAPQIVVRQQEPEVVIAPAPAPQLTMAEPAAQQAPVLATPAAPVVMESASALPREAALPMPAFVKPDPKVSGVVDRVLAEQSAIRLTDGRHVVIGPKTVVFKDDPRFPIEWGQAVPGMTVLIVDPNPVVSVDGRTIRVNDTVREEAGGTLIPDQTADYRGFPAASDHGGMDSQSGGR